MSTKSPTKDSLEKLRKRLSTIDTGFGSGFYGPKEGRNRIRILPPVGDMEYFFQPVGRHYMPPDGKKVVYCPNFTSDGILPCPVCELVSDLKAAGEKKMADELRIRRSFWMNVVNRDDEKAGVAIYTPGIIVFSELSSLITDPDYGDITDVLNGYDIIIEKSGSGRDTEYHVKPRPKIEPLTEDEDLLEKWLESAKDLTYVEASDDPDEDKELSKGHALFLLPHDRIVKEYQLEDFMEEEDVEEDEEEEEEESAPKSKKHAKVVDESDEDEEEEEETPKPKKHAVKEEVDFRRTRRAVAKR